jgi:hypothetical protein
MKINTVLVLLAALTFAGCGKTPPTGKEVRIQLRRGDALGAAANLPLSPRTFSVNGAETGLSGKIVKVTEEWVVLDTMDVPPSRIWIPKASILLIEYRPF